MSLQLDHFGKQEAVKGVIYKQNVGIFGRLEASRSVWVLYIKKPQRSEIHF